MMASTTPTLMECKEEVEEVLFFKRTRQMAADEPFIDVDEDQRKRMRMNRKAMGVQQQGPVDDKVWPNLWLHEKHLDLCLELGGHGYIDVDAVAEPSVDVNFDAELQAAEDMDAMFQAAIAAGDSLPARVKNARYAAAFRR